MMQGTKSLSDLQLQIEYYISPAFLATDPYLRNAMQWNHGSIPIQAISHFSLLQDIYEKLPPEERSGPIEDLIGRVAKQSCKVWLSVCGRYLCPAKIPDHTAQNYGSTVTPDAIVATTTSSVVSVTTTNDSAVNTDDAKESPPPQALKHHVTLSSHLQNGMHIASGPHSSQHQQIFHTPPPTPQAISQAQEGIPIHVGHGIQPDQRPLAYAPVATMMNQLIDPTCGVGITRGGPNPHMVYRSSFADSIIHQGIPLQYVPHTESTPPRYQSHHQYPMYPPHQATPYPEGHTVFYHPATEFFPSYQPNSMSPYFNSSQCLPNDGADSTNGCFPEYGFAQRKHHSYRRGESGSVRERVFRERRKPNGLWNGPPEQQQFYHSMHSRKHWAGKKKGYHERKGREKVWEINASDGNENLCPTVMVDEERASSSTLTKSWEGGIIEKQLTSEVKNDEKTSPTIKLKNDCCNKKNYAEALMEQRPKHVACTGGSTNAPTTLGINHGTDGSSGQSQNYKSCDTNLQTVQQEMSNMSVQEG